MAFLPPIGAALAAFFGTTGVIATTAAVATTAATAYTIGSVIAGKDSKGVAALPTSGIITPVAPKVEDSLVKAQQDADERRKMVLRTGGLVNPTGGGGAPISSGQTQRKTLLGQ